MTTFPAKTIRGVFFGGKKILVRVGFDLPFDLHGDVEDQGAKFRIEAGLETLNFLLNQGAKIILLNHFGRPGGKKVHHLSNEKVAGFLRKFLSSPVIFCDDVVGNRAKEAAAKLEPSETLVLENPRFLPEEENNDENFAKELASLGDVYIDDAFSESYRAVASNSAVKKFLPSYAGFLFEKEYEILNRVMEQGERPIVLIIGGAKIKEKSGVIKNLLPKVNHILLGGAVANTILHSQGIAIGKSLVDPEASESLKDINLTDAKIHLPVDTFVTRDGPRKCDICVSPVGKTGEDEVIFDIGPETQELFKKIILEAKTIIWSGPLGKVEIKPFNRGTEAILKAISRANAFKVAGGGDTVNYISERNLFDTFNHVSTGGSSMLHFLSGKSLPALEALIESQKIFNIK